MARVLVVDDDRSIRRTLEKFLLGEGYEVATATTGREALAAIGAGGVDVALLDLGLPEMDGLDVLAAAQQLSGAPPIIVVTAHDDMQSTVQAIQRGAYDYLVKPVDIERLRQLVGRALESQRAPSTLVAQAAGAYPVGAIIGKSPGIHEIYKAIGAVSVSRASVLVLGESGTGKELVAKAIHAASPDRDQPFVAVNCTAFAAGLLESELFGHVRGAFTGAVSDKLGRFELAGAGTLFLDEVAEIPVELQAKLLRVLQERTFERVGDTRSLPLRARVIAATHRDLGAMVREGAFRDDLLYRLKVVEIRIPPLRERREDIPVLVDALLAKINREVHKRVRYVPRAAMALLEGYPWPGNVRELENALTRAVVLAKSDVLEPSLLPIAPPAPISVAAAPTAAPAADAAVDADGGALLPLREVERRHIERVLAHTGWNKRRACALLDISRPTLDRKIDEFGLKKPAD